jgi:exonuclease SbcD
MRFLHTSDWHLGRSLFGVSLLEDQAHALEQVLACAVEGKVDAVLLAGDVYDRSSPPADAVELLDETLTRLVVGHGIPVVMIAGNHDSGERLGFGSRLLGARGLHVAGTAPRIVRFDDAHGAIEVVALPFAEPVEVAERTGAEGLADHEAAMRADIAAVLAAPGAGPSTVRRVAVAHAFVAGGATSESERPLVLGNAALVPASCFDSFAYAALGHLHRPQRVGRPEVRYSGSLLKYSFDESSHRKGVSLVEIDAAGACAVEEVALTPRRDVRVLEGTLEDLRRGGAADSRRDDFVMVRLLDRGAVLDAIGKLRDAYPNCLRVQHDVFSALRGESDAARADPRRHDETELFQAFFREVTGQEPDGDEALAFAEALLAVRRAEAEA